MRKGFDIEPVYNEKILKVETKSYEVKISINFCNDKMPKEGCHFIFLSVVLIDSVFKMSINYYLQVFLEECEYTVKEKSD